ncbi:hypothetical protein H311_02518 [Anncaliia algerae PRA109]|nr:hypothetical protein H311_02518 [Anncaliia algerae PRA109]
MTPILTLKLFINWFIESFFKIIFYLPIILLYFYEYIWCFCRFPKTIFKIVIKGIISISKRYFKNSLPIKYSSKHIILSSITENELYECVRDNQVAIISYCHWLLENDIYFIKGSKLKGKFTKT